MNFKVGSAITHPLRSYFRKAGAEVVYNKIVKPYFKQTHAKLMLGGIASANAAMIGGGLTFNFLMRDVLNHLVARDLSLFAHDMETFTGLALGMVGLNATRSYITQKLKLSWGNWAKDRVAHELFTPKNRHRLVAMDHHKAEPEQRIAGDIDNFVNLSEPLTVGLGTTAANLSAFSFVLFNISPVLFAGTAAFCVAGTWVKHWCGRGLVELNNESVSANNQYRTTILRASANAHNIAFYKGEKAEQAVLSERLQTINNVSKRIIFKNTLLETVQGVFDNVSFVYPYLFVARDYFKPGSTTNIGDVQLSVNAFHNTRFSGDWYGRNQTTIVQFKACAQRLAGFFQGFSDADAAAGRFPAYHPEAAVGVSAHNLVLRHPKDDHVLCKNVSFDLKPGDHLVLTGASGGGKTTLLSIIAGVRPLKEGQVTFMGIPREQGQDIFIPQHVYVPDLPLRQVLSYPKSGAVFSDGEIRQVLEKTGLADIAHYLDDDSLRGNAIQLSGGQYQRLNFARLLLHKPAIIGLDEATAGLPAHDGVALYKLLFRESPNSIVISIAHRPELLPLHNVEGRLSDGEFKLLKRTEAMPETTATHGHEAGPVMPAVTLIAHGGQRTGFSYPGPHLAKC